MKQATAAGGNRLIVAGSGAEEVAEFVVAAAEALRRGEALEAAHASDPAFHAAVDLSGFAPKGQVAAILLRIPACLLQY